MNTKVTGMLGILGLIGAVMYTYKHNEKVKEKVDEVEETVKEKTTKVKEKASDKTAKVSEKIAKVSEKAAIKALDGWLKFEHKHPKIAVGIGKIICAIPKIILFVPIACSCLIIAKGMTKKPMQIVNWEDKELGLYGSSAFYNNPPTPEDCLNAWINSIERENYVKIKECANTLNLQPDEEFYISEDSSCDEGYYLTHNCRMTNLHLRELSNV